MLKHPQMKRAAGPRWRNCDGVTFVEVLVAGSIFAVAIQASLSMYKLSDHLAIKAKIVSRAADILDTEISRFLYVNFDELDLVAPTAAGESKTINYGGAFLFYPGPSGPGPAPSPTYPYQRSVTLTRLDASRIKVDITLIWQSRYEESDKSLESVSPTAWTDNSETVSILRARKGL